MWRCPLSKKLRKIVFCFHTLTVFKLMSVTSMLCGVCLNKYSYRQILDIQCQLFLFLSFLFKKISCLSVWSAQWPPRPHPHSATFLKFKIFYYYYYQNTPVTIIPMDPSNPTGILDCLVQFGLLTVDSRGIFLLAHFCFMFGNKQGKPVSH